MRLICNRYSILVCEILERDDFGVVEKTHLTSSGCVLHEIYELQWRIQDFSDDLRQPHLGRGVLAKLLFGQIIHKTEYK